MQGHIRALERAGILRARLRTGRTTRYSIHTDSLVPLVFEAFAKDEDEDEGKEGETGQAGGKGSTAAA